MSSNNSALSALIIRGIVVHTVREDADVRAHAHHLLRSIGQRNAGDVFAVVVKLRAVHIGQRILGQNAVQLKRRFRRTGDIRRTLASLRKQRIMRRRQVLLVVPFALADAQIVVVSAEYIRHGPALGGLSQTGKKGPRNPLLSAA